MKRTEFKKLKVGDLVITNGMCRKNKGILCRVTYICGDVIWISPVNGKPIIQFDGYYTDWNEVTFRAVNVTSIKKKQIEP